MACTVGCCAGWESISLLSWKIILFHCFIYLFRANFLYLVGLTGTWNSLLIALEVSVFDVHTRNMARGCFKCIFNLLKIKQLQESWVVNGWKDNVCWALKLLILPSPSASFLLFLNPTQISLGRAGVISSGDAFSQSESQNSTRVEPRVGFVLLNYTSDRIGSYCWMNSGLVTSVPSSCQHSLLW